MLYTQLKWEISKLPKIAAAFSFIFGAEGGVINYYHTDILTETANRLRLSKQVHFFFILISSIVLSNLQIPIPTKKGDTFIMTKNQIVLKCNVME